MTRLGWWRRVGIRQRIRFHDLRDTCASHLLSGTWGHKWSIFEVSKHLSHSNSAITEARYAHLIREARLRTAALTESVSTAELLATAKRSDRASAGVLPECLASEVVARNYLKSSASQELLTQELLLQGACTHAPHTLGQRGHPTVGSLAFRRPCTRT
jgi:hypothetical protein